MSTGAPRRLGVVPFDRDLLKDYLERKELSFTTDEDGDFQVAFSPHDERGYQLTVLLIAHGTNEENLAVRTVSDLTMANEAIGMAMNACNHWNMTHALPKAFVVPQQVEVHDEAGNESEVVVGLVVLEAHFPLPAGVTQPILDEFCDITIQMSFGFWEWFTTEVLSAAVPSDEPAPDAPAPEGDPSNN